MTTVTLLTKEHCGLCEHAWEVLGRVQADYELRIESFSIDSEPGASLAVTSGMAFPPGVLLDGEPFAYGRLSERKLRRALDRQRAAS